MEKISLIHLIGASGYIGNYLSNKLSTSVPIKGYYHSQPIPGGIHFNLLDTDPKTLSIQKGDRVLVLAAKSQIDYCKNNLKLSRLINVEKTKFLLSYLNEREVFFVFFSSDNVYPCTTGGYDEDSSGPPVNEYGRQKKEVEDFILKNLENYCILRMSKIVGFNDSNPDLIEWLYKKLIHGETPKLIKGQNFQILDIKDLTKIIEVILKERTEGVYNIASKEKTNRISLLSLLAKQKMIKNHSYKAIPMNAFGFSDKRPNDSTMKLGRFHDRFDIPLSTTGDIINNFLKDYSNHHIRPKSKP